MNSALTSTCGGHRLLVLSEVCGHGTFHIRLLGPHQVLATPARILHVLQMTVLLQYPTNLLPKSRLLYQTSQAGSIAYVKCAE